MWTSYLHAPQIWEVIASLSIFSYIFANISGSCTKEMTTFWIVAQLFLSAFWIVEQLFSPFHTQAKTPVLLASIRSLSASFTSSMTKCVCPVPLWALTSGPHLSLCLALTSPCSSTSLISSFDSNFEVLLYSCTLGISLSMNLGKCIIICLGPCRRSSRSGIRPPGFKSLIGCVTMSKVHILFTHQFHCLQNESNNSQLVWLVWEFQGLIHVECQEYRWYILTVQWVTWYYNCHFLNIITIILRNPISLWKISSWLFGIWLVLFY